MRREEDTLHIHAVHFLKIVCPVMDADKIAHFWSRCDRSGGDASCWIWQGAQSGPYGRAAWPRRGAGFSERTHRIAFAIANGWLPKGRTKDALVIRHTCDTPLCCNPSHLLTGTHADNADDAISRGRAVPPPRWSGDGHPRARLSAEKVAVARSEHAKGATCISLARRFGVGETTMGHALAGDTWRDA